MSVEISTQIGQIEISNDVLANIAGIAAMDCYGLVGMASRSQIKDGIIELLGRENLSKGVEVRNEHDDLVIDMYIIVGYGTKISEVAHNIQSKVKYTIDQMIGLTVNHVNIFIQDVRLVDEV